MDPNQQPNPVPQPDSMPQPAQPYTDPRPSFATLPSPDDMALPQSSSPQLPTSYAAPSANYDPNYLDSIAPAATAPKFLSGTFGKLFFVLIGLFVLGVSLIVAFSGKDNTADLQQVAVRLDNLSKATKTVQKQLKSRNLASINSNLILWLSGNTTTAEDLLKKGGVKKTEYSKEMLKSEKKYKSDLDAKFEDARLSARLNRVYSNTMASETLKLVNMFNKMAKSQSQQIRDFAKKASTDLSVIQKQFDDYKDDGN